MGVSNVRIEKPPVRAGAFLFMGLFYRFGEASGLRRCGLFLRPATAARLSHGRDLLVVLRAALGSLFPALCNDGSPHVDVGQESVKPSIGLVEQPPKVLSLSRAQGLAGKYPQSVFGFVDELLSVFCVQCDCLKVLHDSKLTATTLPINITGTHI
jgi:hypothetical protein